MNSSNLPAFAEETTDSAFARLRSTQTFRDGGHDRWRAARWLQVGAGLLGSRLAPEIVRSGGQATLCDPESGRLENLGTQRVEIDRPKAETVAEACNQLRPASAEALIGDVRQLGPGFLRQFDGIIDATDDPGLAFPLTEVANGLGLPLVRLAVDGTGDRELGRVLVSHGGAGHACQVCPLSPADLWRPLARTRCPGDGQQERNGHDVERPPSLAGGAIALTVVGLGLLQLQRLTSGNELADVLDREFIVDLTAGQFVPVALPRSERCLSGHLRWEPAELNRPACETTFAALFGEATRHFGTGEVTLEPYGHPLCVETVCGCGVRVNGVGTAWRRPPVCPSCGQESTWRAETARDRVTLEDAREFAFVETPLDRLGLPERGAMFVARVPGKPPWRMLLS